MSILSDAIRKTSATLDELTGGPRIAPDRTFPLVAAGILALAAGVFGTYLASETGLALVRELKRRQRLREKRPESPSLRGTPTPEEIEADGAIRPRTLAVRLRLGSRLADLEPTLDNRLRYRELGNGQKRIKSRAPGLKGWLGDRRISVNYSTLVRYKKLAQRLRQVLSLDDRLPLEWLLPGEAPETEIPADLRVQQAAAKRRLARMLREHPNFSRLARHVETQLGLSRLLAVRRAGRRRAPSRRSSRHLPGTPSPSAVAIAKHGDFSVHLVPGRVEATKQELVRFLQTRDLPGPLCHLRNKVLHWMRTVESQD